MDSPDRGYFNFPIDEITLKEDTLLYLISAHGITFKGHVNKDYSIGEGSSFETQSLH